MEEKSQKEREAVESVVSCGAAACNVVQCCAHCGAAMPGGICLDCQDRQHLAMKARRSAKDKSLRPRGRDKVEHLMSDGAGI